MDRLPASLLNHAVHGTSLNETEEGMAATLRDQLSRCRPTLLAFLRHFGCTFCREMVKDIRIAAEQADADGERRYPRVVFVHMGTPEQGGRFFGRYWPGAPAISDPDKLLYEAVGLTRGAITQLFGPRVLACGMRAILKGHRLGRPVGDPFVMPGLMMVSPPADDGSAAILWRHEFRHAGDHPNFTRLADIDAMRQYELNVVPASQAVVIPGAPMAKA